MLRPAALILCAAVAIAASRPAPPRFSSLTELPGAGIRFRMPSHLAETPVPSPAKQLFRVTDTTGTRTVECVSPRELWRHSQTEGMWSDAAGVAFAVARVKTVLPKVSSQYVPADAAPALLAAAVAPSNWTAEALVNWSEAYAGQPVAATTAIQRPPQSVREAWSLLMEGGNACAVVFRPYASSAVRRIDSPHFLFAWVRVPAGVDSASVATALRDDFLPSVSPLKQVADPAPDADPRFRNRRVWDNATASAELEASRKRVAESIRNLRDWWYADTPHYILLSNLPSRNRQVVRELQTRTERFRELFEQAFPPSAPASAVSVIRVFTTDDEYEAYVGPQYRWTTGVWVAPRRELVARPVRTDLQRGEQERFLGVVAHEAFHQYISATTEPAVPAPWFNEGHAELFGQASIDRDKLAVPESPLHTPLVERLARARAIDAARIMSMSYPQFYAGNGEVLAANYATAWALAYFLHKSAGADQKSQFRGLIPRYRAALTVAQEAGTEPPDALAGVDQQALNAEVNAFWSSNARRQAAKKAPLLVCPP